MPKAQRPVLFSAALGGYLLVSTLSGCSSAPQTQTPIQTQAVRASEHIEDPMRRLQAQAELESITPDSAIDPAIIHRLIPDRFAPLTPGSPAHQRAMTPLAGVLATIEPYPMPAAPQAPSLESVQQATKLYASARAKRQAGDFHNAIDDLTRATALDPTSAALFLALGDLYLVELEDYLSASAAYQQAVDLGSTSARALTLLATKARREGNTTTALQLAAAARSAQHDDQMAQTVSNSIIGKALLDDGFLLAGATALSESLNSFDPTSRDPVWRSEIIRFMGLSDLMWMRIGDAWTALGATPRATSAYANATPKDRPISHALVARRIGSLLNAGQPGSATLAFLDHINEAPAWNPGEEQRIATVLRSIDSITPILPGAIHTLHTSAPRTPSQHKALMLIELAARTGEGRIEALMNADAEMVSPVVVAIAIEDIASDDDRFDSCVQILQANPQIAQPVGTAFVRSLHAPFEFLQARRTLSEPAQRLLIARSTIELGRPDILIDTIGSTDNASVSMLEAEAQISALNGNWADADGFIESLIALNTPASTRAAARSLLAAQQPDRAWTLITESANYSDASPADLHTAAAIALGLNKPEDARSFLERALEADPSFAEAYEMLLQLHSPGGSLEDQEEHTRIIRQLTQQMPHSDLFALLRANEMARNGLLADAEKLIIALTNRSPHRDIGIQLLMSIWIGLDNAGDQDALDRAEQWLRAHLARIPASNTTRLSLARLLVHQDQPQQALELLDEGYASVGSFTLALNAEQILADSLDRKSEAVNRALERTAISRTIDATLEHAQRRVLTEQPEQAVSILRSQIPSTIQLLPSQQARLSRILFLLTDESTKPIDPESWIALFDHASQWLDPMPHQLLRIRLALLAQSQPTNHDLLTEATTQALDALPAETTEQQRNAVEMITVQQLLRDDRTQDAFIVLHKLATRTGVLDERLAIEIVRFGGAFGDASLATHLIERLARDEYLQQIITLSNDQLGMPPRDQPATTEDELRADVAYIIASVAQAFGRDETITPLFELALSYDLMHPWANNDFGYMLIDNDERIDEAEQMLVRAAEALPDSSSVLDSLGWARYKQGKIIDRIRANGVVDREGAITILKRAIQAESTGESNPNATIRDHLADAYWRMSEFDLAIQSWLDAEDIIRSQIQLATTIANVNQQALDRLTAQLRDIRLKIADAESGESPRLAPIPNWPDPVPTKPRVEIDPGK